MTKKLALKVKTLGGLKITNNKVIFPQEKKRSSQVELLIIYLIFNRSKDINNLQLINFLWPEGNADKPEGALRNLIYRARKELKSFCSDIDFIESKERSYYWNHDVECRVDYDDILRQIRRVAQENDPYCKFERCLELANKYTGQVLPEFQDNAWVAEIGNSLKENYSKAVLETITLLADNKLYEQVIEICEHLNNQEIIDTSFFEIKLYAYYKVGKIDQALSFYHQIIDYYYSKYGIEVSPRIKEIYKMILDTSLANPISVDELEQNLAIDDNERNTFYCDFDVFKNIYQINLRSIRRTMKTKILVLFTVVDTSNKLDKKMLYLETEVLKKVIAGNLRKNDVYSKFNMTQYALILASSSLDGARIAVERIVDNFNKQKAHDEIILNSDLKVIE